MDTDMYTYRYMLASRVALVVKNWPAHAGDVRGASSIPGLGRSPGGGHGNPVQCSCLENPMDRGAWGATVHGVAWSRTVLDMNEVTDTHVYVLICVYALLYMYIYAYV